MTITIEAFKSNCEKSKCLRRTILSPQCKKNYKQEACYKKYVQKIEKDKQKANEKLAQRKAELQDYLKKKANGELVYKDNDPQWTELKKKIIIRDKNQCRFFAVLTEEEKLQVMPHLWGDFKKLDGAHVIARSLSAKMKYDEDNVYLIYRYLHKALDEYFCPFTQQSITKEEVEQLWIRIIGLEKYVELCDRAKKKD